MRSRLVALGQRRPTASMSGEGAASKQTWAGWSRSTSWLGDEGRTTFPTTHVYGEALATCGSGGNDAARAIPSDEKRGISPAWTSPGTRRFVVVVPGVVGDSSLEVGNAPPRDARAFGRLSAVRRIS
mmetsp:Transcript_33399/g.76271  ORF Transcript_33399/g.76271 Transcript_33399/m.76271 type:complete len:127 (-) Transcript_33399:182-562(-)